MLCVIIRFVSFFFFNDTATTEIYTLSLHDALPICRADRPWFVIDAAIVGLGRWGRALLESDDRSEEHTSELQSRSDLVCRLLLEKKKTGHHGARTTSPLSTRPYHV